MGGNVRTRHAGATKRATHRFGEDERAFTGAEELYSGWTAQEQVPQQRLQPDSVGSGHLQAESITTEKLAVGAVTELTNDGATVVIDAGGIAVQDGALSLEDEFGKTVLTGGGIDGAWEDLIGTGIRNGSFGSNTDVAASTGLTGRTSAVPYWTLANITGTTTWDPSVGGLKMRWSAINDAGSILSDRIRVRTGVPINFVLTEGNTDLGASSVTRVVRIQAYDVNGAYISSTDLSTSGFVGGGAGLGTNTTLTYTPTPSSTGGPAAVHFIRVELRVTATGLNLGTASYSIAEISIQEHPEIARSKQYRVGDSSVSLISGGDGRLDLYSDDINDDIRLVLRAVGGDESALILGSSAAVYDVRLRRTGAKASKLDANGTDDLALVVGGHLGVTGRKHMPGVISPAALTANVNDYNPTGGDVVSRWRLTNDGVVRTITGIVGPAHTEGMHLYLHNIHATVAITIAHDSGSSIGVNRILCPNNAAVTLRPNGSILLVYDLASTRWRVIQP